MNSWNRHIHTGTEEGSQMFIRIEESEKYEIGSGTKLLFTFLNLRFFDTRREKHNFLLCSLLHLTPPRAAHFVDPNWFRLGETKNRLPSPRLESQLTRSEFKSQLVASWHDVIPPSPFPIRCFHWDICDCHIRPARAWKPALNVCT